MKENRKVEEEKKKRKIRGEKNLTIKKAMLIINH